MVLSHAAENEIVKNTKLNTLKTKANNLGKKIPDATTLTHINKYITNKQNSEKKTIWNVDKNKPDTRGLVTATVLNTKVCEVENKIPDNF